MQQLVKCSYNLKSKEKGLKLAEGASDSEKSYFDIKITSLYWEKENCVLLLLNDITFRLKSTQLQKLQKYKQKFLECISHNLKTHLNGIILYADSLSQELGTSAMNLRISDSLDNIRINTHLLSHMIFQIIEYSRVEKNAGLEVDLSLFDLKPTLDHIRNLVEKQCELKHISLSIQLEPREDLTLENDQAKLQSILISIISSFIQLNSNGHIEIKIREGEKCSNTIKFLISFTSSTAQTQLAHQIFYKEIDEQIEEQHKKKTQLVDLGLVLCQKFLESIGPPQSIDYQVNEQRSLSQITFQIFKHIHPKKKNTRHTTVVIPQDASNVSNSRQQDCRDFQSKPLISDQLQNSINIIKQADDSNCSMDNLNLNEYTSLSVVEPRRFQSLRTIASQKIQLRMAISADSIQTAALH